MPPAERILIVGLSGRALAASARAAGLVPLVLDAFGDLDTREAALAWRRIPLDADWRFEPAALLAAAAAAARPPMPLVWGSGFERHTCLLRELASGRELLGCSPETVEQVKDPLLFADTCRRLGVPHPEIRLAPPADPGVWLVKRRGGAGGGHVRAFVPGQRLPAERYLQRLVPGRPVSALLVMGVASRCLAFSEQWHDPSRLDRFRFAGAAAPAALPEGARDAMAAAALAVADAFALRGLVSADFLLMADGSFHLLEINPRPGAALEALELAHGVPLLGLHVAACRGQPVPPLPEPATAAATLVVYARQPLRLPAGFAWPGWAGDRTPPPATVPAGAPLCTVRASGLDAAAARAAVTRRRRLLVATLRGLPATEALPQALAAR
ncbi:ATP-grasp domain-containing protein [Marinimicrococcus flavescens]|uniref:ATP-grasp domain-containing protein n=1 Tax=Marinimicrococcus flavescens TaxID=3031815 RepID=A0AAP3XQS7_9PROT|nr:ATP-grasp domain-containing protein [Marinimicrococcus flavescens]